MFDKRMLKQAQELQAKLMKAQEELGKALVEGSAGGGAVKVVINGHQEVQSVTIAPEVANPQDIEMLQDLVMAAIRDANAKVKDLTQKQLGSFTGGMKIPGLM